jgi:hypothetical protein
MSKVKGGWRGSSLTLLERLPCTGVDGGVSMVMSSQTGKESHSMVVECLLPLWRAKVREGTGSEREIFSCGRDLLRGTGTALEGGEGVLGNDGMC